MQTLMAIVWVMAGLQMGLLDDEEGIANVTTPFLSNWHVVRAQSPESWVSWEGLKAFLGGIEVTGGVGLARVTSRIVSENGDRITLANGNAPETSTTIGLFGGPMGTGWRFAPTGGWFTRNAFIRDFSEELPGSQPEDAMDVGAMCSSPDSGESIPCNKPNRYDLSLQSFYAGALAGYELVVGNPRFQVFVGGYGSLNVLERRTATVGLSGAYATGTEWKPLRSFGVQTTSGFKLPRWHSALRVTFDYQRFGRFAFAQPLEFRGPVVYDDGRKVFLRPRYTVEDTALAVVSLKVSAAYIF